MSNQLREKIARAGWNFENSSLHTEPACEHVTTPRPCWWETAEGQRVFLRRQLERMGLGVHKQMGVIMILRTQGGFMVNGKRCKDAYAAVDAVLGKQEDAA